jgi:antitoxin component of MazEF toxin-antitoxin module
MNTINNNRMPLTIPLRKVGNSMMLTIPQTLIRLYGLADDAEFEVAIDKDFLILRCKKGN